MSSDLHDFVMNHTLFSHHDHHCHFEQFEEKRPYYDALSMLGYADADIVTAAGPRPDEAIDAAERTAAYWPKISTTGYGRAVTLGCRELFDLDYSPENFSAITEKLQSVLRGRSAQEVYDYFVKEKANVKWVLQDSHFAQGDAGPHRGTMFPEYYRFAWRMDALFAIKDPSPIETLEKLTGLPINSLEQLAAAMNVNIDTFKETGRMAAFKLGIAYARDLIIGDPSHSEAEIAFDKIRKGNAPGSEEAQALSDYMIHRLLQRAAEDDIPVQIHTGYLAGNWGSLAGTKALYLLPLFEKYRKVRFDIFHASWPWTSELGAIAKNYPNVYPDMCWIWAMNPEESERTLSEWLDGVPFNKIFAFGADTGLPWCEAGYATQARLGVSRVLENKVQKGFFSKATAREVASTIMLENGENFHRVV
jgi:uncharacterized protein